MMYVAYIFQTTNQVVAVKVQEKENIHIVNLKEASSWDNPHTPVTNEG